jgi:MFS family permease
MLCSAGIGIIIGTILQAASVNYGMMIFARIFNGIFNGMLTSTVPTYQSECSRPERRGPDVMISATVNIFGLMCSYWVGLAFYYTSGQISWRFPVTFQCVFTFAM